MLRIPPTHARGRGTANGDLSRARDDPPSFDHGAGPRRADLDSHIPAGVPTCAVQRATVEATETLMGLTDLLRALGIPSSWHFYVISLAAMLALAGLDFTGAVFAKAWVEDRQIAWFVAGLVAFGVLFVVYAHSLRFAELSIVTFGWIVFLQVGLLVYERVRYDVALPTGKWVAIAVIMLLQAYLILAPNANPGER